MKVGRTIRESNVRDILAALDNRLTPDENFYCKILGPITTPGTVDTEFTVNHNLGRIPKAYIWNVGSGFVIYDSQRANWTTTQMFLKCTGTSVALFLIVF